MSKSNKFGADDRPERKTMHDDYLWDSSNAPDPEIQQLEKSLLQFRHAGTAPIFPATLEAELHFSQRMWNTLWMPRLAAAAVVAIAIVAGGFLSFRPGPPPASRPGWEVASLAGHPQVGSKIISSENAKGKLEVGQFLVTDAASRAFISVASIGEVQVEPGSRLRLVETRENRKRIALEVGTIHAAIWAPPGEFVVDTPAAVAVDLGCMYTLHVADDGSGILRTTLGWVGFHVEGRDSFIPAGAACATRPKLGPGTPYFEDASEEFRGALHEIDFGAPSAESRNQALKLILARSRPRDALTLWHLLRRVNDAERPRVYARLASLAPPPIGATREGILSLDSQMLDAWWNTFGLGDISVWRFWEQSSAPHATSTQQPMQKKQLPLKQVR